MRPNDFETETPEIDATELDAVLRDALEPEANTIDRLMREALNAQPRRAPRRHWQVAAAVAFLVLAVIGLDRLRTASVTAPEPRPAPLAVSDAEAAGEPPASKAAALRISNEDGLVTITTPAGSKMVFLPLVSGHPAGGAS